VVSNSITLYIETPLSSILAMTGETTSFATSHSTTHDSQQLHNMSTLEVSQRPGQIGLPTPGTPPADDFEQKSPYHKAHQIVGLTTPVSPAFESFHTTDGCNSQDDQLLYPEYVKASQTDGPLFDVASHRSPSPAIQYNYQSPVPRVERCRGRQLSSPSRAFLQAIPEDVVGVVQIYNYDPVGYTRYIAEQNDRHRAMRRELAAKKTLPPPTVSSVGPRDSHTLQQLEMLTKSLRIRKGKSYSCTSMTGPIIGMPPGSPDGPPLSSDAQRSITPDVQRNFAVQKRSREQFSDERANAANAAKRRRAVTPRAVAAEVDVAQAHNAKRRRRPSSVAPGSPAVHNSPSNKNKTHTRAQASKKVEDDLKDSEWAKLPDYCPDTTSLDAPNTKKLRVSWPNSDPLDLSNDADEQFMHPQEIELAATLRFHCNQYLINKRRIFKAKVKAMQEGKAFNKTACQQCTAMDVNKASKLWAAFDEVGWFDEHWFKKFL
jgi:hypothetical protein